jgi:hypothetical protein
MSVSLHYSRKFIKQDEKGDQVQVPVILIRQQSVPLILIFKKLKKGRKRVIIK